MIKLYVARIIRGLPYCGALSLRCHPRCLVRPTTNLSSMMRVFLLRVKEFGKMPMIPFFLESPRLAEIGRAVPDLMGHTFPISVLSRCGDVPVVHGRVSEHSQNVAFLLLYSKMRETCMHFVFRNCFFKASKTF